MKKKLFLLPCIAAAAIATFVGAKTFKSNAVESNDLLMANVEALTSCEVTAKAKKMGVTVASAYLECLGKGTCSIPNNEFGLKASCSGKQVKYDLYVAGKKVN